jgi:hypothetical protein
VATSSHKRHFLLKTEQHQELFSLFDHIITGETSCGCLMIVPLNFTFLLLFIIDLSAQLRPHADNNCGCVLRHLVFFLFFFCGEAGDQVSKGKPDPEIFQSAAAAFIKPPTEACKCLVFEDAPTGVQAGIAAGMQVIAVPDPNLNRNLIDGLGAAAVLGSLEDFCPEHWGLPAFGDTAGSSQQAGVDASHV